MQNYFVTPRAAERSAGRTSSSGNHVIALRWLLLSVLAVATVCPTARAQETDGSAVVLRQQILAEAASLVVRAHELGRRMFERYSHQTADDTAAAKTALAAAMNASGARCGFSYRVVIISGNDVATPSQHIPLKAQDDFLVFVIGEGRDKDQVVLGRHFRVDLSPDGKTVHSVAASTDDCTVMPLSSLVDAPYVKEKNSNGPTEFQVFLSLLHKAKFRVRAAIGDFVVNNGDIEIDAFNRAYRPESAARVDCRLPDGTSFRTSESACRGAGGTVVD